MNGLERIAIVLTLMEQLQALMAEENAVVRKMQLDRLNELNVEKTALADAFEVELRELRKMPELMVQVPDEHRSHFENSIRTFQKSSKANAEALAAARVVVERMMRKLGESMAVNAGTRGYGSIQAGASGYGANLLSVHDRTEGKVIPVAFNRQL